LQWRLVDIFKQLDTDASGSIDHAEMVAIFDILGLPRLSKKVFGNMDVRADGKIDKEEWLAVIDGLERGGNSAEVNTFLRVLAARQAKNGRVYEKVIPSRGCVLAYDSKARLYWDLVMLLVLFYIVGSLPLVLAFGEDFIAEYSSIEIGLEFYFVFDIMLNFRTTYIDSSNTEVCDGWRIAKMYLKTWFLLDAVCVVPIGFGGGFPDFHVVKLLKFSKLAKVVKVLHVQKPLKSSSDSLDDLEAVFSSIAFKSLCRVALIVSQLVLACHWISCLLLSVGGDCIKTYQDVHESKLATYISAMYWAATTMTTVGYGDITPQTDAERIFITFAMIIGGCAYGYMIGSITSMVTSSDLNAAAIRGRMDLINAWLDFHHEIPRTVRLRVRNHFRTFFKHKAAVDDRVIMNDLSPELNMDVAYYLLADTIRHNLVFHGLPGPALARITQILKESTAEVGECIAVMGNVGTGMVILSEGTAEFQDGHQWVIVDGMAQYARTKLNSGDSFGEEVLLGFEVTFEYTVLATSKVFMHEIPCAAFNSKFLDMPAMVENMRANFRDTNGEVTQRTCGVRGQSSVVQGGSSGVAPSFPDAVFRSFQHLQSSVNAIEEATKSLMAGADSVVPI